MNESLMIRESDVREALAPVLDWFQSEEDAERPLVSILRDVVQELIDDRNDNLAFGRLAGELRMELDNSDSYGGPRVDEGGDRAKRKILERMEAIRAGRMSPVSPAAK